MWKAFKIKLGGYAWNLLIGVDQMLNALLGGYPDETFSARVHRKALAGQWFWRAMRRVIDHIFFLQEDHCRKSYESEAARRHSPREFANG